MIRARRNNVFSDNRHNENDNNGYNKINSEISNNLKSLEYLLSIKEITNCQNDNKEEPKSVFTLIDFTKRNLNYLKEDLIYYFSSQESLLYYKNCFEEEIKYEFYKDLNSENFFITQKERFKLILSKSKQNLNPQIKISKLSNFNDNFCLKNSLFQNNEINNQKLIRTNIITMKLDEYSYLITEQEIKEDKIITLMNDLKNIFYLSNIDIESIGLIQFNLFERYLISVLKLIENKINTKNDTKYLTAFSLICLDLLKSFKSQKLLFYIIKLLKRYKNILDLNQLNIYKDIIQFIPNNCFDINLLNKNIQKVLISDLRKILIDKYVIKKALNEIKLNINDYRTLNYDNYILIFIGCQNYLKEKSKESYFYYYKIDLNNNNIIVGKINLLNEDEERNKNIKIKDINFSVKKEFIYIFYIIENSSKYYLKYKIFNKYSINIEKEDKILFKQNFIPINLFNDNKYLYCISDTNQILLIKRNIKMNYKQYINCNFRLYENDLMYYREIKELSSFEMYNSLSFNNLFILINPITKDKYIAKFIFKEKETYILNIYEQMKEKPENDESIKIAYNDSQFIVTKIKGNSLLYDSTNKNFNNLIDKGILLLPFNTNLSNYNYSIHLDEYLIQEYSSIINIYGNFELINAEKENYLIKFPFSLCCNFDKNVLNYIIDNIIEDFNINSTKLNLIIILKQIICSLYNSEIFEEENIKVIFPYFKKMLFSPINPNKKIFNKILKEIIEISSYIRNNIIIDEFKFVFNGENNINIKSKFLMLELIFQQNKIKNYKDLYKYLIELERDYLTNLFEVNSTNLSYYYLYKKIMNTASESFYKEAEDIQDELISLIPCLLENIKIILELYKKNMNNKNNNVLKEYYFIYNSFSSRSLFFIIEYLLAHKNFLRKKEYIIKLYEILLIMDKYIINYNDCLDMNNIIEIKNNSFINEETEIKNYNLRDSIKQEIKLKEKKDLIITKRILSKNELKELENSIKINIKSEQHINQVKFIKEQDNIIYPNVSEINVEFNVANINNNKSDFIIHIIPLKDKELFNSYKENKDYEIISLIEKTIIHYLLSLFEDIISEIEKYNKDKIVKNQIKIFQTELFRYLSIPIHNQSYYK